MKQLTRALCLPLLFLFFACSKEKLSQPLSNTSDQSRLAPDNNSSVFFGPTVQLGNGHIRSFGVLAKQTDAPLQIGFELTPGALQGLPHDAHGEHAASYLVRLHPRVAAAGVFDHLVANWNAHGHPPGPYLSAHFDFHFYLIALQERLAITANDPLSVAPLPGGYLPADYIGPLGPEPQMGGHCVDVTSPELNGGPFTHTFIFGAYNSKVAFYEPMITHDYLLQSNGGTFVIKQPASVSKSGYYPTRYTISKAANGNRYVILTDFVFRLAS